MSTQTELRSSFAASLSSMYGGEVPLYNDLVRIVSGVNEEDFQNHPRKAAKSGSYHRVTVERHGAIRLGSAEELEWMSRMFAVMGMYRVGEYDLREASDEKPVSIVSTTHRALEPEELAKNPFRVFTSMLVIDDERYFPDKALREEIREYLSKREIMGPELKELIMKFERRGRLNDTDGKRFVELATDTFRLPTTPVPKDLYDRVFERSPVAADIIFGLNINHLTPPTTDIDECYRRMEAEGIKMIERIQGPPRYDGPVILLRQTSFKALEEEVDFLLADGKIEKGKRAVRFGEIEQRGVALTPDGRSRYDILLTASIAELQRRKDLEKNASEESVEKKHADYQSVAKVIFENGTTVTGEDGQSQSIEGFPRTYKELAFAGLAYFTYHVTNKGRSASRDDLEGKDHLALLKEGYLTIKPIIYEDFLPKSAAGIFQANIEEREDKVKIMRPTQNNQGDWETSDQIFSRLSSRPIDPYVLYAGQQARSLIRAYAKLSVEMPEEMNREQNEALKLYLRTLEQAKSLNRTVSSARVH